MTSSSTVARSHGTAVSASAAPAAAAAAAGCRVAGGLEVLLHQAVAQVELMTGRPGPTAEMAAALMAAAGERRH